MQVAQVKVEYLCQWWKEKHHQHKLQQVMTTTCASGVFAPADGRIKTTSASCSRFGPPHVQVEYLHQLMIGNAHQCKVQRSGPTPGQGEARCSNNMQLQPPPPPIKSGLSTDAIRVADAALNATGVMTCRLKVVV